MRIPKYRLEDGALIPKGWGIAYYDMASAQVICYPIPFNLLINGLHRLYWWITKPSLPELEKKIARAYSRGKYDGIMMERDRILNEYNKWMDYKFREHQQKNM